MEGMVVEDLTTGLKNEQLVLGLDLGAFETRAVLLDARFRRPTFMGLAAIPSVGWQKGRLTDPGSVLECVRRVFAQIQGDTVLSINCVFVGLANHGFEPLSDKSTVEIDADMRARFPFGYFDQSNYIFGRQIKFLAYVKRIIQARSLDVVSNPEAALKSVIMDRNRDLMLIDLGDQSSRCLVWKDSKVAANFSLSVRMSTTLRNVGFKLGVSVSELREYLPTKTRLPYSSSDGNWNLPSVMRDQSRRVTLQILFEVMEKGVNPDDIPGEIVLIGAGAEMDGLAEEVESAFDRTASLGGNEITLLPGIEIRDRAKWCTALGLAISASEKARSALLIDRLSDPPERSEPSDATSIN